MIVSFQKPPLFWVCQLFEAMANSSHIDKPLNETFPREFLHRLLSPVILMIQICQINDVIHELQSHLWQLGVKCR